MMATRRSSRRVGAKPATADQRAALRTLHMNVYGYITETTAAEIAGMTWLRAAQETATLQRAYGDRIALESLRAEVADYHRSLFGIDKQKQLEIKVMDFGRAHNELMMLRRMEAARLAGSDGRI